MAPCTHPVMKRLFCLKAKKRPHYEEAFLPKGEKTASLKAAINITGTRSNHDPRWTQKNIYTAIFTRHIRSWILCTPVTLKEEEQEQDRTRARRRHCYFCCDCHPTMCSVSVVNHSHGALACPRSPRPHINHLFTKQHGPITSTKMGNPTLRRASES